MNFTLGSFEIPTEHQRDVFFSRSSDVENNKLFNVMSDVQNYPLVFPKNIISVKILNQTENEIYAYEEVTELGIKSKLLVKHTIIPHKTHTIEILDGDANGTKIMINFTNNGNFTQINSHLLLKVKGFLLPFGFLPDNNLQSALNTVLTSFEKYAKNES